MYWWNSLGGNKEYYKCKYSNKNGLTMDDEGEITQWTSLHPFKFWCDNNKTKLHSLFMQSLTLDNIRKEFNRNSMFSIL